MALKTTKLPEIDPDPIRVQPGKLATVVDPIDATGKSGAAWFPTLPLQSGDRAPNEVIGYIHTNDLYADIAAAMRTCTGSDHFVYLLGWNLWLNGPMVLDLSDPSTELHALLTELDARGVNIRAMVYHQNDPPYGARDNSPAVKFINGLKNGRAILDNRVVYGLNPLLHLLAAVWAGAHHQKIIIVNGSEGLVTFQGGYDLDPDRQAGMMSRRNIPQGLHDVHTRIRGLLAGTLWTTFVQRWNDHFESDLPSIGKVPLAFSDNAQITDKLEVLVGRTLPNSREHSLFNNGKSSRGDQPYDFKPDGDTSVLSIVGQAIGNARKFIYLEDQYLVYQAVSEALKSALPRIQKLIILIAATNSIEGELKMAWTRRKKFVDNLVQAAPDKVIVCQLWPSLYVHAKAWIFDDEYAIVGSANVNRRGYTHDSEQNAGIYDPNLVQKFGFAHALRMHLWAKHMWLRPIDFVDPIASSVHWPRLNPSSPPPPMGDVIPYDPNADDDSFFNKHLLGDPVWDGVIDPYGQ